MTNIARTICVN